MNRSHKYTYYLDECLGGNKVADILRNAGLSVELHSSHFERGTADETWLPFVGDKGWILLTQDKAIKRRKNEIEVLRRHKVCAFIIAAKGLRGEQIGDLIVSVLPKVERILKRVSPPLIAAINRNQVVELKEGQSKFSVKRL